MSSAARIRHSQFCCLFKNGSRGGPQFNVSVIITYGQVQERSDGRWPVGFGRVFDPVGVLDEELASHRRQIGTPKIRKDRLVSRSRARLFGHAQIQCTHTISHFLFPSRLSCTAIFPFARYEIFSRENFHKKKNIICFGTFDICLLIFVFRNCCVPFTSRK